VGKREVKYSDEPIGEIRVVEDFLQIPDRIAKELLQTAKGMHEVGILDDKTHEKITMRHLKGKLLVIDSMTSEEIRSLREKAHRSQAAFASYI